MRSPPGCLAEKSTASQPTARISLPQFLNLRPEANPVSVLARCRVLSPTRLVQSLAETAQRFSFIWATRTLVSIQVTEGAGAEGQVHLVLQLLRTCLAAVCPFEIGRVLEPGQFQILPPGCLLAPGARLGKLGTNCILIALPGASAPFLLSQAFRTTASPRTSLQGLPDSFHQYFFKF